MEIFREVLHFLQKFFISLFTWCITYLIRGSSRRINAVATMPNPTLASSSSLAYEWTYDVFLSFRGEDTRLGFTGHLYHALCEVGVNTFMDDQGLRKGEEITPFLMKAIQESRIAIVIFSENYASSTFCLQELVMIMECLKHQGRLVWPVFYEVDPSDVRHQKGSYAEALAKHETRISDKDKVEKWRLALQKAASLSGWHSNRRYEYDIIRDIVLEVSKKINRNPLHVAKYPVGLESRVQKGSDKTEIIMLHLPKEKEVHWDGTALEKMKNLKILVVKNARFSRGPSALPESLRVLKWCRYPESSLPADFDAKKLVILDLSMSSITFKNPMIMMKFKYLMEMKLSGCELLKEVSDMSGAPNLKKLHLDNCKNLVEVHDSVGFLDKLECLNLNHCTSLRVLPRGMYLTSLKTMSLRRCTSLMSFPEILGKMENIRYLDLIGSAISVLPFSIGNLVGLTRLNLNKCTGLVELPISVFMLPKLENLEANYCDRLAQVRNGEGQDHETVSSSVRDANFNYCYLTEKFLATLLPCLCNVTSLSLNSSNITVLPSSISACLSLTELYLNECKELREIRSLPPNIKYLSAINCKSLTSESKEILLNQKLHETGGTHFKFPGSAIPSWLNYSRRGPSLRFWFRNKFPAITLCVVGVFGSLLKCKMDPILTAMIQAPVITVFAATKYSIQTNHTILSDLLIEFGSNKFERFLMENKWYSAEISFEDIYGITDIEWMGVHVQEHKTNMADIQFTEPKLTMVDSKFWIHFITDVGKQLKCGDVYYCYLPPLRPNEGGEDYDWLQVYILILSVGLHCLLL